MASLISGMAKEIFQVLKGSGRTLSLYDEHGNKVFEPESAQSFFAEPDKLMVTINQDGADSSLNMYVSEASDIDEMKKMIDTLRVTATRHNFLFNIRKYGKELNPKDFAFKATPMVESMYGSAKTSYQNIGKSKLIVRHSSRINEESRGARSRRIESIFVETAQGERFKFPNMSLHGARAFAKHLDAGGDPRDNYSNFVFKECEKQATLSGFRRRIRKLGESNTEIAELGSLLKTALDESKGKITKAKGNRFYTGIVETIVNAPNRIGPLKVEIAEQAEQLKTLLAIDETSVLFPALESVATIILEMKQMDPINFEEETILHSYVAEQAELLEDLVESLVGEFGLEEGVHFERSEAGVSMLDEAAFETSQLYAGGISGLTLQENAQDKFLAYATSWTRNRMKNAGMDQTEMDKADPHKQAAELAQGLKQIVAGNLPITIKGNDSPKFANPMAAIAYKLDKILAPGSGLKNDALFNFISAIDYKLSHGDAMDANERFFATKLADIVDKHALKDEAIMPEMNALEEWMQGYGLNEAGPYDVIPQDTKVEQALDNFDIEAFLNYANRDLNNQMDFNDPEDRYISHNAVFGMVSHYLEQLLGSDVEIERYEPQIDAFVDSDIIPALSNIGVTVQANEGLDEGLFEDDLNEDIDDATLKNLIMDALASVDNSNYYGIMSGDDADDDAYALRSDLGRIIGDQVGSKLMDMDIDTIITLAQHAWGANESLEEAGNHPDDYNASRDPHAGPDYEAEEAEIMEFVEEFVANPPQGTDLAKITPEWFDGEGDDDLINDLASDVLGYAMKFSDQRFGLSLDNMEDEIRAHAKKLLLQKFGMNLDEARGYDQNTADRMNLEGLKDTIQSFVRKNGDGNPKSVYDAMRDYYMDSRSMGPVLVKFEKEVMQAISDAMGVTTEGIDADMGDDFVQDVGYKQDAASEADYIARLRKLAGI